jgi:DUF177 domain-containing protein
MLAEPLPTVLDIRKAAARGADVQGRIQPAGLERFSALLADDQGDIQVELKCFRDEEGRHLVDVSVGAEVSVICQRCLEPKVEHITCESTLALVWSDEQAGDLPRSLDPLIVGEEPTNLWELVEDELILSMGAFHYHDTAECRELTKAYSDAEEEDVGSDRPNPFAELGKLKPGSQK